tara:strand:- start:83 stop:859 length:777 start_codon:yes stop_codon:yes gene_type:complete
MPIPLFDDPAYLPLVPQLLEPDEEFAAMRPVDATTVAAVCRHGYLPMSPGADGPEVVLVKCHRERAVLDPRRVHVPRNVPRYARGLSVVIDRDPTGVLRDIQRHHTDSWLSPALSAAFLHWVGGADGFRVLSIEVYDGAGTRVASELGYLVGSVYTSLSGAHFRNGAGWVQMVAWARILADGGCAMWDLGMDIEYKRRLGARLLPRQEFLGQYSTAAGLSCPDLPVSGRWQSAGTLVDAARAAERAEKRAAPRTTGDV